MSSKSGISRYIWCTKKLRKTCSVGKRNSWRQCEDSWNQWIQQTLGGVQGQVSKVAQVVLKPCYNCCRINLGSSKEQRKKSCLHLRRNARSATRLGTSGHSATLKSPGSRGSLRSHRARWVQGHQCSGDGGSVPGHDQAAQDEELLLSPAHAIWASQVGEAVFTYTPHHQAGNKRVHHWVPPGRGTPLYTSQGCPVRGRNGTHQLVYVPEGLDWLILSKEACQALGIIKDDFPAIGSFGSADINDLSYSGGLMRMFLLSPLPSGEDLLTPCSPQSDGSCSCPRRKTAPSPPPGLSADQLKKVIVRHYVWCRKLVSVVSRILDNHSLVRQSGSQILTNQAGPKVHLGLTKIIWLEK